jgi:hypothetical protein
MVIVALTVGIIYSLEVMMVRNDDDDNDDNDYHYSRCNKVTGVIKQQNLIENDNDVVDTTTIADLDGDIVVVDLEKEMYSKINIDYDNYMTEKVNIISMLTIALMNI